MIRPRLTTSCLCLTFSKLAKGQRVIGYIQYTHTVLDSEWSTTVRMLSLIKKLSEAWRLAGHRKRQTWSALPIGARLSGKREVIKGKQEDGVGVFDSEVELLQLCFSLLQCTWALVLPLQTGHPLIEETSFHFELLKTLFESLFQCEMIPQHLTLLIKKQVLVTKLWILCGVSPLSKGFKKTLTFPPKTQRIGSDTHEPLMLKLVLNCKLMKHQNPCQPESLPTSIPIYQCPPVSLSTMPTHQSPCQPGLLTPQCLCSPAKFWPQLQIGSEVGTSKK